MRIGIIGLGLIGGSMALSIRRNTNHVVLGYDIDAAPMLRAKAIEAIHDELTPEELPQCDIVLVSLYPEMCVQYIKEHADDFKPGALVIDCAGVKRHVCSQVDPIAAEKSWTFIGGHPMAGKERGGFVNATSTLFDGASMILTPDESHSAQLLERMKAFFLDIGFASVTFSDPEEHDRIIAYTSQLAHITSSAYVKSPEAQRRRGFSAGSFRDMTRVARLDEDMWTELFLDDADFLTHEVDVLISHLCEYRDALAARDAETLRALLLDGKEKKSTAGGA